MDKSPPTYGNWINSSAPGLAGMSFSASVVLIGGLMLSGIVGAFNFLWGLGLAVVGFVIAAPLLHRDRWGQSGLERLQERVRWLRHRRSGATVYASGPLARTKPVTAGVPGLGAGLSVFEARDGHGRPFVVLHHRRPGHVATVIECAPPGDSLVDPDQVDQMVAGWGWWLGTLAFEPALEAMSVVVETIPDPGVRLERAVLPRIVDDAPPIAAEAMREAVATFGSGAASTRVFVTLTWSLRDAMSGRRRPVQDLVTEIGTRLPELTNGLASAGAGQATPVGATRLSSVVRAAFDPALETDLESWGEDLDWSDAGPQVAEEFIDRWEHDGSVSVSWMMGEAPRGAVRSHVLRRLLSPHNELARKRVTLLYRPVDAVRSAQLVDSDVLDATFVAGQSARVKARMRRNLAAAEQSASEEAEGAVLTRFGMVVTVTLPATDDGEAVERAVSVVDHLGSATRIRLRVARRAQSSTFLAGLPLGLVLPAHVASLSLGAGGRRG